MSLLLSPMAKNSSAGFYNGVATTSLRLDSAAKKALNRTMTTGNRRLFTYSFWFKVTKLGSRFLLSKGENVSNADISKIQINSSDQLVLQEIVDDSASFNLVTTRLFRDTSAWYNVVIAFDTAQGTAANRVKVYVNGVQETSFGTASYPSQNYDALFTFNQSSSSVLQIGRYSADTDDASEHWDGYLSDITHIDGTALDASSFGELKNGAWIPINTSGLTFGDEGYLLKFDQVGVGTASTSTIGADTSGNANHFTSVNIVASDCAMPDSPENNFATWNPIYRIYGDTGFTAPTNGGLFTRGSGDVNSDRGWGMSTIAINEVLRNSDGSGVYMEVRSPSVGGDNGYIGLFGRQGADMQADGAVSRSDNSGYSHYHLISPNGRTLLEAGQSSSSALAGLNGAQTDNAVIGFAVKSDGKFFISVDGTFSTNADGNTQNPVTGANPMGTIDTDIDFFLHAGNISVFQANFGQDSTFGGNETATTNADANNIGAFHTAPPTGYLALCSANMAEPTIGPNSSSQATDYFNTLIYDGNDDATRTFDVGFVSDWSWFKARNADGIGHQLYDSSRGVQKFLASNTDADEDTNSEGVTSFNSSGLLAIGNSNFLNKSGRTHVVWNWKANGGTTTTNDASSTGVGTLDSVFQANTTAGFSIVTYTGFGETVKTIAHGLGVIPQMIIFKSRGAAGAWHVYHQSTGNTKALYLNATDGETTDNNFLNQVTPTATLITLGTGSGANPENVTMVAYCFAEVEGYSKFGSYSGNNATDGSFIFTNFTPALVIIKHISGTAGGTKHWYMWDNKRSPQNVNDNTLLANSSDGETADSSLDIDILSNGFKLRNAEGAVNNAAKYIYMCWAETPFKYATAR